MIHQIIIILLIVGVKAIFSAGDTAFTYMNKSEISQLSKKDKKAKKLKELLDDSNKFFGIIEVGLNMSELIASAYASETIVKHFTYLFEQIPLPRNIALFVASLIMTVILAYVLLVFGSFIPKRIARNHPKKTAYRLANILWIVAKLNYPFERIIDFSNMVLTKLFHLKQEPEERLTEKQLKMIIAEANDEGIVAGIEKRILYNALNADDITIHKIMIPKEKVDFININDSFETILDNVDTFRYTRMPVYQDSIDNIIGMFNVKDIAIEYARNKTVTNDLSKFLRKVKFINENEKIFDSFRKLQKANQVIAVVVDNVNKPVGIISIEDILETLVGKIFDEYDRK